MKKLSNHPQWIAIGFATVGFVLLFLAWNAAAELDHVSGQIPILISGGLTGLGFIAVGLTMAVTTEMRRTTTELRRELRDLAELVSPGGAVAAGPTVVPTGDDFVVGGSTSFHRPDCRLVMDRTDLQRMDADVAVERGLGPCRICKPAAAAS